MQRSVSWETELKTVRLLTKNACVSFHIKRAHLPTKQGQSLILKAKSQPYSTPPHYCSSPLHPHSRS